MQGIALLAPIFGEQEGNMGIVSEVLNGIGNWFLSLPGVLTTMIVSIVIARLILTRARDKDSDGKHSGHYKRTKLLIGVGFAILIVNYVAMLLKRLFSFGKQLLGYGNDVAIPIVKDQVVATIILALIVGVVIRFAWRRHSLSILSAAGLVAIAGVYGIFRTGEALTTVIIGAIFLWCMLAFFMAVDGESQTTTQNQDEITTKDGHDAEPAEKLSGKKTFLLGALWLGSVALSYIAGEKSLLDKAQTYMKGWFQHKTTAKEAAESQKHAQQEASETIDAELQPLNN